MSKSRVLIVAHKTAADDALAAAVARRAARGSCEFTLLVPVRAHGLHWAVDPEDQCCEEAELTIEAARPVLESASGGPIATLIGSHDPFAAVQDALNLQGFDEVIVATLPGRLSKWLHFDLPRRIERLGLPVTHVRTDAQPTQMAA